MGVIRILYGALNRHRMYSEIGEKLKEEKGFISRKYIKRLYSNINSERCSFWFLLRKNIIRSRGDYAESIEVEL